MRFAILNCEPTEKWRSTSKQSRPNLEGEINKASELYCDHFGEPEDTWKSFACYKYEWPSREEAVREFDAVFITGSSKCVGDASEKWIAELGKMILLYAQEDVRMVGICFGAQLLAKALGGRVGRNPGGIGFVARAETLEVLPPFSSLMKNSVTSLTMLESHADQVLELPEEAVRLARSPSCLNEIWCLRTILAIQSHPEFGLSELIKIILPSLKQRRMMSLAQVIQNEKNIRGAKLTHGIVRDFIKDFTRSADFFLRVSYQELFPIQMNSKSDAALIRQIEELTEKMAKEPFTLSSVTRNPDVGEETREAVKNGVKELTDQFSTLMLKELKRAMVDYSGVEAGNAVATDHAKGLLKQALELYQPVKNLRAEREKMTDDVQQILKGVTEMVESLEISAHLLEEQTRALKQRLAPNELVEA